MPGNPGCISTEYTDLNDQRRKIIEDFRKDVISILADTESENQAVGVSAIIKQFIRRAEDAEMSFLAFRRYAIKEKWLGKIVKSLN